MSSSPDILNLSIRFFKGGRWLVRRVAVPKMLQFEKWNLIENWYTRNTSIATK